VKPIADDQKRRRFTADAPSIRYETTAGPPSPKLSDRGLRAAGGRGFLLAGPFVVTEEVWVLAAGMNVGGQGAAARRARAALGYAALYRADTDRDPDVEKEIAGIPPPVFVSDDDRAFGSVTLLALLFDAPGPSSSRRAWSASSCGRRQGNLRRGGVQRGRRRDRRQRVLRLGAFRASSEPSAVTRPPRRPRRG